MSVPWNVIGFLWRICGSSARDFPHRGSEVRLVTGPLQHDHVAGIKYRVAYKHADGGIVVPLSRGDETHMHVRISGCC